jgi:hypothetical protein
MRGIEEIPPRTHVTLEPRKPRNPGPLLTDLGAESKGKEPRRVHAYLPHQIQRERPQNRSKKIVKKGLRKSPKRTNRKDTSKPWGTTSNHLYIPMRFIQGLACLLIILPSHKIWRTDTTNQRGGSEWEPIKILLEGDGNSNKANTASNTRLRLTTQVGQAHVAIGVPLDLGTNTQPSEPKHINMHSGNLHDLLPVLHRSDRWPAPVRPVATAAAQQTF